jgi:hypothetical protein
MNPPFVNGRYIHQWETPINEWLVLAYGRDQSTTRINEGENMIAAQEQNGQIYTKVSTRRIKKL